MNQQIKTSVGVAIIIILAVTIGFFTWKIVKIRELDQMPSMNNVSFNKETAAKNENFDWKTYTNEKYGFSFQYPSDGWEIKNGDPYYHGVGGVILEHSAGLKKFIDMSLYIEKSSKSAEYNLKHNLKSSSSGPDYYNNQKPENIIIDEQKGYMIISGGEGTPSNTIFLNDRSGGSFIIVKEFSNGSSNDPQIDSYTCREEECQSMLMQILSTFKFTDNNQISDWKTYTSEKYGFSFQYPSSKCFLDEDGNSLIIELYKDGQCPNKKERNIGTLDFKYKYDILNAVKYDDSLNKYIEDRLTSPIKSQKNIRINGRDWHAVYLNCDSGGEAPTCYGIKIVLLFKDDESNTVFEIDAWDYDSAKIIAENFNLIN